MSYLLIFPAYIPYFLPDSSRHFQLDASKENRQEKKNCSQGKILQQKFTDQILTTLQHFGLLISRDLEGVKQPNLYHSMSTSISLKILSQKVSKLKVHFLISIFFHPQLLQRVR